jgi:transposase
MAPNAAICLDPFHAVALAAIAAKALDTTRREQWARVRKVDPDAAKTLKGTRFVLLKNPENHSYTQTVHMAAIKRSGEWIWRAYQLKEGLRGIYADHSLRFDESVLLLEGGIS